MSVSELIELFFDRLNDIGVTVAEAGHRRATGGINVTTTLPVEEADALAAHCKFKRLAWIAVEDMCHDKKPRDVMRGRARPALDT